MHPLQSLEPIDLAIAMGMIGLTIALSIWQQLGLAWGLTIAAGRTIVQLLAVGLLLALVFELSHPGAVISVILVMVTIAAIVTRNRISQRLTHLIGLVWLSLLVSTALTLTYTNFLVIRQQPWYEPQYVVPLAGMVLGNAMNGAAIAGERLVSHVSSSRLELETHLSLGATGQQAIAQYRREAIKAGMIPILNAMMVVGVVTLPGTITGQLLGGIDPLQAAAYQMLIMFMLAFATLLTTVLIINGLCRRFFNPAMQLVVP